MKQSFLCSYLVVLILKVVKQVESADIQCKDMCLMLNSTNANQDKKVNCYCSRCDEYDDCCLDMTSLEYNLQQKLQINYECNIKVSTYEYVYSVVKCPLIKNTSEEILTRIQCEKPEVSFGEKPDDKIFKFLPVFSSQTGLVYRNMFCAKCNINKFDPKSLRFFGLIGYIQNKQLGDSPEDYRLLTEKAIDSLIANKIGLDKNEFLYKEPKVDSEIRKCLPSIAKCLPNYDYELNELCNSHTSFVYQKKRVPVIFKNKYCALCNGVNLSELYCDLPALKPPIKSLQLLFDLTDLYGEVIFNMNLKINDQQLNDNFSDVCLQISKNSITENILCNKKRFANNSESNATRYQCLNESNVYHLNMKSYITIIGNTLSIFCLASLLTIYSLYKDLRNLPGKILVALSFSLLASQFLFLISTFLIKPINLTDHNFEQMFLVNENNCIVNKLSHLNNIFNFMFSKCYFSGLGVHFFYLHFFTWSNVYSYDLYTIFSMLDKPQSNIFDRTKFDDTIKFIKYLIYALALPFIIILSLLAKQFVNKQLAYGFNTCFIANDIDLLLFFVMPVGLFLFMNFFCLVKTIMSIRKIDLMSKKYLKPSSSDDQNSFLRNRKQSQPLEREKKIELNKTIQINNSNNNNLNQQDKKRTILFLKLVILTGLTWSIGVFNAIFNNSIIWYFYELLNSLQGLFMLFAFVFNKRTKAYLNTDSIIKSFREYMDEKKALRRKRTSSNSQKATSSTSV